MIISSTGIKITDSARKDEVARAQDAFDRAPLSCQMFKIPIRLFGKTRHVFSRRGMNASEVRYLRWHREAHVARLAVASNRYPVTKVMDITEAEQLPYGNYQYGVPR